MRDFSQLRVSWNWLYSAEMWGNQRTRANVVVINRCVTNHLSISIVWNNNNNNNNLFSCMAFLVINSDRAQQWSLVSAPWCLRSQRVALKTRGPASSEGFSSDEDPFPRRFIYKVGQLVLDIGRTPQFLTTGVSPEGCWRLHDMTTGFSRVNNPKQKMQCLLWFILGSHTLSLL